MKKILYLILILPLLFSSCAKEEGCTDLQAANYNPDAEEDDGSCLYSLLGGWVIDEFTVDGISLFSSAAALPIASSSITFYSDNTYSMLTYYADGSELSVDGVWSIIGTSTLRMINEFGDQVDWTIMQINGSQMEIYVSDLAGMGSSTIQLSR